MKGTSLGGGQLWIETIVWAPPLGLCLTHDPHVAESREGRGTAAHHAAEAVIVAQAGDLLPRTQVYGILNIQITSVVQMIRNISG